MRKSKGAIARENKPNHSDYYYGDYRAGIDKINSQFVFLGDLIYKAQQKYKRRWIRFYGLNNKYDGAGNLRG